ncbi:MAG: M28 family peptidase [Prevotella sp.]|jgi:hypothetical protein|nr:M28 family peptidase [Prevotella sp.]
MKKKKKMRIIAGVAAVILAGVAGIYGVNKHIENESVTSTEETERVSPVGPAFNADSAYAYTAAQCAFGPRPMNTAAHEKCGEWIVAKFKHYGCKVQKQSAVVTGYDGTKLNSTNIIASYNPEATTRILICAHWDSRPWADNDPDSTKHHTPIMAANDGASGVAVMIELARLLQQQDQKGSNSDSVSLKKEGLGIDFVCLDAEDWGTPQWSNKPDDGSSWALGAQYFSAHLPQGYEARYGILLDMVGGAGAHFYKEQMSEQYAPAIVKKVWKAAGQAGYRSFFPNQEGGAITDDHLPINQTAHIPTIDIIPYYPDCSQSSFGPTWHTTSDTMAHIDKATLKAVGQTLVQVLFTEKIK